VTGAAGRSGSRERADVTIRRTNPLRRRLTEREYLSLEPALMNRIIYIVGLIVIVLIILSFLGLR
jgi:hypothetical protein